MYYLSGLNKNYFLTLDIRTGTLTGGNIYFYNTDKSTIKGFRKNYTIKETRSNKDKIKVY